jgi:hypothetical protein
LQYPPPSTPPPSLNSSPPPSTFDKTPESSTEKELAPIPEGSTQLQSRPAPNLIDPAGDRTTSQPVRQPTRLYLVASSPKPVAPRTAAIDDGGWRASTD